MKIDYKTYKKPTDFMKFPQGDTVIRIISEGDFTPMHGVGAGSSHRNLGRCRGVGCELCSGYIDSKGREVPPNEPKEKWRWVILDRTGDQVYYLEAGSRCGNAICEEAKKQGDPQQYDLIISKKGAGLNTEYAAKKSPETKPFTQSEMDIIKARKPLLVRKYML